MKRTVFKSARTGKFVTKSHAKRSPSTTYKTRVSTARRKGR